MRHDEGAVADHGEPIGVAARHGGWRERISFALAVLAALLAVAAVGCIYVRAELLDNQRFADRTAAALNRPPVRRIVAREVVAQVLEGARPDLLAARPLLSSLIETVVSTPQFRGIVRTATAQAHGVLFARGGNVVFSIADAGTVVISALRTLAPSVAQKIPTSVDARLLDLRRQTFAVKTLRAAARVRALAVILPVLALLLLSGSVALARRRREAAFRAGLVLAVLSLAAWVDLLLLRHSMVTALLGGEGLSDGELREAAVALWDAWLGGLATWALALAAAGAVLALVASAVLRPASLAAAASRLRGVPGSVRDASLRRRPWHAAGAALALLAGVALLAEPSLSLAVLAVGAGIGLLAFGLGELAETLGLAPAGVPSARSVLSAGAAGAAGLAVFIGGPAIALAAAAPRHSRPPAALASGLTCDGYAQLCEKRLDQVVFAGTHNSMSASESPGWLIPNQERAIARQLDDGVRAFKISTHYGIGSSPTNVLTDIKGAGEKLNRVSENLSEQARKALQRFSGSLGFGRGKGKRAVWLCHTLCELGATSMSSFLDTVDRFLRLNPDQVLVFFDEDYVSEQSLEDEFKRSGLYPRLAVFRVGQELPTLGQMIRSQHNVAVFTQEPVSGTHPWNMFAYGHWIQDTPLGAVKPADFTCAPYRGNEDNPLLMMNNWADVFPPRRSPNLPLLTRPFIVARARRCERERHRLPNLVMTDFYNSGDVIGAVRELNGLGSEKPAPIVPVH